MRDMSTSLRNVFFFWFSFSRFQSLRTQSFWSQCFVLRMNSTLQRLRRWSSLSTVSFSSITEVRNFHWTTALPPNTYSSLWHIFSNCSFYQHAFISPPRPPLRCAFLNGCEFLFPIFVDILGLTFNSQPVPSLVLFFFVLSVLFSLLSIFLFTYVVCFNTSFCLF